MKAPAHYLRVDLGDPGEAEYWLVVLDASRRQLEAAIAAVGCDALEVRAWLGEGERLRATGARSTERPAAPDDPPRVIEPRAVATARAPPTVVDTASSGRAGPSSFE